MADIQGYRFGLGVLLKNPSGFQQSTRSPQKGKTIYAEAQFLAHSPLTFLDLVPAVQPWHFCELDPRTKVELRLDPRFLQKTPWNLVFLANKPLNHVLGLVYAF